MGGRPGRHLSTCPQSLGWWASPPPATLRSERAGWKQLLPSGEREVPDSRHGNHLGIMNYITFMIFLPFSHPLQLRNCVGGSRGKRGSGRKGGNGKENIIPPDPEWKCGVISICMINVLLAGIFRSVFSLKKSHRI